MQYLMRYKWVKLHRSLLPQGKGVMGRVGTSGRPRGGPKAKPDSRVR